MRPSAMYARPPPSADKGEEVMWKTIKLAWGLFLYGWLVCPHCDRLIVPDDHDLEDLRP